LKRIHPEAFAEYELYMARPENKKARLKQKTLPFPVVNRTTAKGRYENLTMDYIIEDMLPLSTVESPAFRKFVSG